MNTPLKDGVSQDFQLNWFWDHLRNLFLSRPVGVSWEDRLKEGPPPERAALSGSGPARKGSERKVTLLSPACLCSLWVSRDAGSLRFLSLAS